MFSSRQGPQWRRIYRQTLTLTYKNLLLFYKAPIATLIRALIFPIVITVVLCLLKHISEGALYDAKAGIAASSRPVKSLSDAVSSVTTQRLVFVLNGNSNQTVVPVIQDIVQQSGLTEPNVRILDNPDDLFDVCKQTIQGTSVCYAAVIFLSFNDTNVDYILAIDENVAFNSHFDFQSHESLLTNRLLPLQWAIDSSLGNFTRIPMPLEQPWYGYIGTFTSQPPLPTSYYWLDLVQQFVAPLFILILVGIVFHLSTFVAMERQSLVADLMAAQMVTTVPRILSTILSFLIIYIPGFVACSILLSQVLFTGTSDGILVLLTLLAGISMAVSTHFVASFFSKAAIAGLYSSVLAVALALITLAATLSSNPPAGQILALALIFPPATWATLMGDIARIEYIATPFTLSGTTVQESSFQGYLYIVFFIVQIILYSLGTYFLETKFWRVTRKFDRLDASSDVALRCTNLSKTYNGRRWRWPFTGKQSVVVAVDSLDLEVKKGSVTFLLGPNGGGKTTTLRCVAGMTGIDVGSHIEINEGGLVFGICPQTNVLWDSLTVQEHIKIWRRLKTPDLENLTVDDEDVLVECDLVDKVGAAARTLSGGQMRKLQLAIAFVGGSKVCCIDEASSGMDPLSRRTIWNIIAKGRTKRTTLITSHFLDEADILADHILIIHKGHMVCEGSSTSLKAQYGESYVIRQDSATVEDDTMVWRMSNSAEATRKLLELEDATEDETYKVDFPTLEQVFLKVTSNSNTAVQDVGGDGIAGEGEPITAIDEKIFALDTLHPDTLELDVARPIGIARQIAVLFQKRYILLLQRSNYIAYGINLFIPIIVAAALSKFLHKWMPLQTCAMNEALLRTASANEVPDPLRPQAYPALAPLEPYSRTTIFGGISAVVGPPAAFSGVVQGDLYISAISPFFQGLSTTYNTTFNAEHAIETRIEVDNITAAVSAIVSTGGFGFGFGLFAPDGAPATLFHDASNDQPDIGMAAFSLLTNRISNSTAKGVARLITANFGIMRHVEPIHDIRNLPIAILLVLAFVSAVSVAIIYPAYEKINHVRALHYSNGVSPFALWLAYLLFDTQFIVVEGIIVWGVLAGNSLIDIWFAPSYLIGVFFLFGIASYLGVYVLSIFVKKAAFAVAVGVHVVLSFIYLAAYVLDQNLGPPSNRQQIYNFMQYGLGLMVPGANLQRALFIGMNSFDVLCGPYGDADVSNPFQYVLYGGIYANLLIQIIFLIIVLTICEYKSADWLRRHIWQRKLPARLHYVVEAGEQVEQSAPFEETSKATNEASRSIRTPILSVSQISKFFGPVFAVENVSFGIAANETLVLLGGNGAGKTTIINMIRGELNPDFGDIYIDGISVRRQPHKARIQMGVCPQDDAIDNLTVRQTLNFYAAVKGLRNIVGNVDRVIDALNISLYQNVVAKNLSGGTRRKLSMAIALLGNPHILLLDEPSTGQDAGAKRILWQALQKISANRAILLTTHSMEEAETLATNVAIVSTKMLVTDTLPSLQASHGGLFTICAIRVPELAAEDAESIVRERFSGRVFDYEDHFGQISFSLPHEKDRLGSIMKVMEELKGEVVQNDDAAGGSSAAASAKVSPRILKDYTVTGPRLEEIFMNVVRRAEGNGLM